MRKGFLLIVSVGLLAGCESNQRKNESSLYYNPYPPYTVYKEPRKSQTRSYKAEDRSKEIESVPAHKPPAATTTETTETTTETSTETTTETSTETTSTAEPVAATPESSSEPVK
ncbi:MAG: hypothetical protein SGI71_11235 [Verrucomicrobiota bacterium]|nr:hypothetical protein [Verrucomicrobiota bacterium]